MGTHSQCTFVIRNQNLTESSVCQILRLKRYHKYSVQHRDPIEHIVHQIVFSIFDVTIERYRLLFAIKMALVRNLLNVEIMGYPSLQYFSLNSIFFDHLLFPTFFRDRNYISHCCVCNTRD